MRKKYAGKKPFTRRQCDLKKNNEILGIKLKCTYVLIVKKTKLLNNPKQDSFKKSKQKSKRTWSVTTAG